MASVLAPAIALGQQVYPSKPIQFVIPGAPGGITDQLGRLIADRLSGALGQRVIVDNKAGAGGNLAAEFVARAAPDGYTILMGTQGTQVANQYLYSSLKFDPAKDFVPAHALISISSVVVANANQPYRSLKELVDYAKQHPGKLTFASAGNGTSTHLVAELFQKVAGVKFVHVPYKGSAPAISDLLGGQVDLAFDFPVTTVPHINAGKLRALAVTGPARLADLPDVPTTTEAGYPEAQAVAWIGMFLPAGTPAPIVDRIQRETARVLAEPAVVEAVARFGGTPFNQGGAAFGTFVQSEHARWKAIIEQSGARLD
ncbi:Bug family tripartite tricarboxylate transporter substrate binding protein [Reyranella sp.]|uniref:Bug family tripartite tricarboxylate transporter substrate binding protein n=1 Tax=Reyranella sp. TaxID=1929291 RepID=UPI00378365A5